MPETMNEDFDIFIRGEPVGYHQLLRHFLGGMLENLGLQNILKG